MGWILVGAMLFVAAFAYVAVQAIALLARGILFVGAAALRLLGSLLR